MKGYYDGGPGHELAGPDHEDEEDGRMATGTVKWFSSEKGYGFITPDGGGKDLFCHFSAIEGEGYRSLAEGQRVEFEVAQDSKGPRAAKVRVAGVAPPQAEPEEDVPF